MTTRNDSSVKNPKSVRILLIFVAITAFLSLLYGILYFIGSPIKLATVSEINDLALCPDNTQVAVAAKDGKLRLWQVSENLSTRLTENFNVAQETPWPVQILTGHNASIIAVAFAVDGNSLFSIDSNGEVRQWDTSGQTASPAGLMFDLGKGPFVDAVFDSDRATVAALDDKGVVTVWQLASGNLIRSIDPVDNPGNVLVINSDGSMVAAADGSSVQMWDVQTGEPTLRLDGQWDDPEKQEKWLGHKKEVTTMAFSPDGAIFATGSEDTTIIFWDMKTGEVAWTSDGHWGTVTTMVFNAESDTLLSGGKDNKIRTFRVAGGKVTATFEGHWAAVTSVAFGPIPDSLLTASQDGTVRVWERGNQYVVHLEWTDHGFQPTWGNLLVVWMLVSGFLGLLCLWGLYRVKLWSHLLSLALYLLGPIAVIGLPLFEVLSYPLLTPIKLQIAAPLIAMLVWYAVLFMLLTSNPVALYYEAPHTAPLSIQLQASQRTRKIRFGLYGLSIWFVVLVVLFSVLRRFNLDVAFMGHFFSFIMAGAGKTLYISAASIALAIILALLGALGRLSKNPIANGLSSFYVSLIRGTPLLVQIYIWYLGLPRLNVVLPAELAGLLALGVNYGAYMTEVFRAGIQAIGKGQYEAAEALGMSRSQTFQRIVLPQAFRIVIPPIGNEFIAMMKDSSLVSVMSIWELTYRAQKIGRQNFRNMETFIIAAAFYWILTVIFQFLQGKLEEHMARGERR
ncbi:MAG: ABC transporter permease subunit [Anaerolineales bacterium]|nr:ABC transporter permease subunit [Anaerolineales bacterium]